MSFTRAFTIENNTGGVITLGTVSLNSSSMTLIGDPSDEVIGIGASTIATVSVDVSSPGVKTGILTVPHDGLDSPYIINIEQFVEAISSWNSSGQTHYSELSIPADTFVAAGSWVRLKLRESHFPAAMLSDARSDGEDIKFSSTPDGLSPLPIHIINWNPGTDVEINVGFFTQDVSSLRKIYVSWGNPSGAQPAPTAIGGRNGAYQIETAAWRLNENPAAAAPQFKDATGHGWDGTASGAMSTSNGILSFNTTGKVDTLLNTEINPPDPPTGVGELGNMSDLTFEVVLHPNNISGDRGAFNVRSGSTGIQVHASSAESGKLKFFCSNQLNQSNEALSVDPISTSVESRWAFVRDAMSSKLRIYKNGILDREEDITRSITPSVDPFIIGDTRLSNNNWRGTQRDFNLTQFALDGNTIKDRDTALIGASVTSGAPIEIIAEEPPVLQQITDDWTDKMNTIFKYSATNVNLPVLIKDSAGDPATGLTNNTAGLSATYRKSTDSSPTSISLVAGTLGSYTSGGFAEIGGGFYEIGLPSDAVNAGGITLVVVTYDGVLNPPEIASFTGSEDLVSINTNIGTINTNISDIDTDITSIISGITDLDSDISSLSTLVGTRSDFDASTDYVLTSTRSGLAFGILDDIPNNGSTTATSITVADGAVFRVGDIIQHQGLNELIRVTAVASNVLTVTRGWGSTTPEGLIDGGILVVSGRNLSILSDLSNLDAAISSIEGGGSCDLTELQAAVDSIIASISSSGSLTVNTILDLAGGKLYLVHGDTYEDASYDRGKITIPIPTSIMSLVAEDTIKVSFTKNSASYTVAFETTGTAVNGGTGSQAVEFIINQTNANLLDRPTIKPGNQPVYSGIFDIELTRDTDNKTTLYTGDYYLSKSVTP